MKTCLFVQQATMVPKASLEESAVHNQSPPGTVQNQSPPGIVGLFGNWFLCFHGDKQQFRVSEAHEK